MITRIHVDLLGICSNSHKHEIIKKKIPKRCESTMTNACLISSPKTKHKNDELLTSEWWINYDWIKNYVGDGDACQCWCP